MLYSSFNKSVKFTCIMGVPENIRTAAVGTHMPQALEKLRRCRHCSTRQDSEKTRQWKFSAAPVECLSASPPALQNFLQKKNELRLFRPLCQCQ